MARGLRLGVAAAAGGTAGTAASCLRSGCGPALVDSSRVLASIAYIGAIQESKSKQLTLNPSRTRGLYLLLDLLVALVGLLLVAEQQIVVAQPKDICHAQQQSALSGGGSNA